MTEFAARPDQDPSAMIREHAELTAELTRGTGVLAVIAEVKLAGDPELAARFGTGSHEPGEVFDIVLARPQRGEPLSPRWQLIEALNAATKGEVEARAEDIIAAATQVGMRREGLYEDYSHIRDARAVFVCEGGANKTSIVRRGVIQLGLEAVHGTSEDLFAWTTVYQLGSGRMIDPKRADGSTNPEHRLITGLTPYFIPRGPFTEFEANVATARAEHFHKGNQAELDAVPGVARMIRLRRNPLRHVGMLRPKVLMQVMPEGNNGLLSGFDALAALQDLEGRQFVIGTNGQYRPKAVLQAMTWARNRGIEMLHPVALGDEPGDNWTYKGEAFQTPPRPAAAYVNELAIYGRQTAEYVANL